MFKQKKLRSYIDRTKRRVADGIFLLYNKRKATHCFSICHVGFGVDLLHLEFPMSTCMPPLKNIPVKQYSILEIFDMFRNHCKKVGKVVLFL